MSKDNAFLEMGSLDEMALDEVTGGLSLGFAGHAIGLVGSTNERGFAGADGATDLVGWHGVPSAGNVHGALSLLAPPEPPPVAIAPVAPVAPVTPVAPVAPVAPPVAPVIDPAPHAVDPIAPPPAITIAAPPPPPPAVTPPPAPSSSSFYVQSFGDPHVQVMIDGVAREQVDYGPSIANFETFANTVGGPTTVSTHTYNLSGDTHITVNHDVTIASNPGTANGWSVNVDGEGHVAVTTGAGTQIVDASGSQMIDVGNADVIVTQDHVTVEQRLADGGTVTTTFDVHRGVNGVGGFVDIESVGHGNAGLSGFVTQDHHGDAFATYGAATYDHGAVV